MGRNTKTSIWHKIGKYQSVKSAKELANIKKPYNERFVALLSGRVASILSFRLQDAYFR